MSESRNTYSSFQKAFSKCLLALLFLTVVFQSVNQGLPVENVITEEESNEQVYESQETPAVVSNFSFDCSKALFEVYSVSIDSAPMLQGPKPCVGELFSCINKILTHTLSVNAP